MYCSDVVQLETQTALRCLLAFIKCKDTHFGAIAVYGFINLVKSESISYESINNLLACVNYLFAVPKVLPDLSRQQLIDYDLAVSLHDAMKISYQIVSAVEVMKSVDEKDLVKIIFG